MPALMSHASSDKFKDNCLEFYPKDQGTDLVHLDDSLTSLHWLQNFRISNNVPGGNCSNFDDLNIRHIGYPQGGPYSPSGPTAGDTAATGVPLNHGSPISPSSDSTDRIYGINNGETEYLHIPLQPGLSVEVDYKTNPKVKPHYSYVSLICMAMQASKQPKVTVSDIYNWIMGNFCYYRHAEPGWRNSIRHNLSYNCCFKKLPRQKDIEPGKGGFWQIDPQYANMLLTVRRRRMSANYCKWLVERSEQQRHNTGDYNVSQNECRYQGSVGTSAKGEHLSTESRDSENDSNIAGMMSKSPLLATETHATDIPWGDVDLESFVGDALRGNCTIFEDLRHLGYPHGSSHSPSIATTSMPLHLGNHIISGNSSTDMQTLTGYGQTGYPHVLEPCPLVEGPRQLGSEMVVSDSASVIHGPVTAVELGLQGRRCGNSGGDLQNQACNQHHRYMDLSVTSVQ